MGASKRTPKRTPQNTVERKFSVKTDDRFGFLFSFWKDFFRKNLFNALRIFFVFYLLGLFVSIFMEYSAENITVTIGGTDIENATMNLVLADKKGVLSECPFHQASIMIYQKYFTSLRLDFPAALDGEKHKVFITTKYGVFSTTLQKLKNTDLITIPNQEQQGKEFSSVLSFNKNPDRIQVDLARFFVATEPLGGLLRYFFPIPLLNWSGNLITLFGVLFWFPIPCFFLISFFISNEMFYQDCRSSKRKITIIRAAGTLVPVVFCCTFFIRFLYQYYYVNIQELIPEIQKIYIYQQNSFRPDPALLKSYTVTLLAFPFFLAFWYAVSSYCLRWIQHKPEHRLNPAFAVCSIISTATVVLLTASRSWTFEIKIFSATFFVIAAICLYAWSRRLRQWRRIAVYLGMGLSAAFVVTVFLIRLHNTSFPPEPHHFNPVYYSVAQTMAGKTPLVDVNSPYGCYALFLEPILRFTGYGVFPFVLLMNILTVVSFLFLFLILRLFIRDRLILVWGTFYLFMFVYVFQYYWSLLYRQDLCDLMYQQQIYLMRFPLRTITVYASVFFMLLYFKRHSRKIYYVTSILVFTAPFWNLDTGIILPVIWFLSLILDEFLLASKTILWRDFMKKILRQLLVFFVLGIAVTFFVSIWIFLRSGGIFPNYISLFQFIRSHAVAGYYAVPMQLNNIAVMVWLIYAAGLYYTLHCLVCRRDLFLVRCTLILSLLGFGLFPYYLNRSQMMNLFMTVFPAVMLTLLLLDRLGPYFRQDLSLKQVSIGSICYVVLLTALLWGVSISLKYIPKQKLALETNLPLFYGINNHYQPMKIEINSLHSVAENRQNTDFLKQHTISGESVLILSDNYDAYYYGTSQTKSVVNLPSSTEWSQWSEINLLTEFLRQNETVKVFADPNQLPPMTINKQIAQKIGNILEEHYQIVEKAREPGTLILLQRRSDTTK